MARPIHWHGYTLECETCGISENLGLDGEVRNDGGYTRRRAEDERRDHNASPEHREAVRARRVGAEGQQDG